jgi:phosphohistidine swiveling domain-containing protein
MKTMIKMVSFFNELTIEQRPFAGGKGGTLARLYQADYPVPDGFVIMPLAFEGDDLKPEAWSQTLDHINKMRKGDKNLSFAIRSSGHSEDSEKASFAGEFETILNVRTDDEIMNAIHIVRRSRSSPRVKAYSETKGLGATHDLAVIVQKMIQSDIAGVLFTAEPVTGNRSTMTGNFVLGLGDKLVSGEAAAHDFIFKAPNGRYVGPPELDSVAKNLFTIARRLENDLGTPQDIEWAVAQDKIFILQSRPITTLISHKTTIEMLNDSLTGEYLWVNSGFGENLPGVMSPSTWSVWQIFLVDMLEWKWVDVPAVGNICGRPYMNMSLIYSVTRKIYGDKKAKQFLEPTFGVIPDVEIPTVPMSYMGLLTTIIPGEFKWQLKLRKLTKEISRFLESSVSRCNDLKQKIRETDDKSELISLWHNEVKPYFMEAGFMLKTINEHYTRPWINLSGELINLMGKADADLLLSTVGGTSEQLASLGLMIGLSKIVRGEMSREEYIEQFGHRCQYEWHLLEPRPYEDPSWLEKQLDDFNASPVDVEALLKKRQPAYEAAWKRFREKYPHKSESIKKRTHKFAKMSHTREDIRSEVSRTVGVIREWFLKAGELTSIGEDVFFLSYKELLNVLSGDNSSTAFIPARRENYTELIALPPYPSIIIGSFNPFQWASDPNRRNDVFNSRAHIQLISVSDTITGNPGSGGQVEGTVRIINTLEEGNLLQKGEILVTKTTNVGWTPLFPRAAAVVTDVGMPLAHAAIVARELGIPAVVGCSNATTRLQTGDRVLVDGEQGIVKILSDT